MKTATIQIETSHGTQDSNGREYITFRPIFHPDVCASGQLFFAIYQVWTDEPETHHLAKQRALLNAVNVMRKFADELRQGEEELLARLNHEGTANQPANI